MKSFYLTLPSNVSLHQKEREYAIKDLEKAKAAFDELTQRHKRQGEQASELSAEIKKIENELDELRNGRLKNRKKEKMKKKSMKKNRPDSPELSNHCKKHTTKKLSCCKN